MQALQDRSSGPRKRRTSPWIFVIPLVALVAAGGAGYALTRGGATAIVCAKGVSCSSSGSSSGSSTSSPAAAVSVRDFSVASTSPSAGATGVRSSTTVEVTFSADIKGGGVMPTLSPPVQGAWRRSKADELVFSPSAPFIPYTKYTLTVPGGQAGVQSTSGAHLAKSKTVPFTIASGNTKRLQELLAELGYLPLAYAGPTPAPQDMATVQPGTLTWRWSGLPTALTSQWFQGSSSAITKGAVMMFETESGLTVDGIPGPEVWASLLTAATNHRGNTEPVSYVLVTKNLPEHLTAWVNGTLELHDIPVNTGTRGATTGNGTYQVFEHVRESHMSGTDVTGSHYTITTVPWVSYFHGGEALHYYPRASYGFPQSNGCTEMQLATAAALWPNTPIGTLVTVQGPTYGGTGANNTASNTTAA